MSSHNIVERLLFFVERDIAVTNQILFSVCACGSSCMHHASEFIGATTSTFMHGFQNYLAQLLSVRRRSAIRYIFSGWLKVKVTLEGQMIKWS